MKNRISFLLFFIVLLAAFLRFYQIGTNPPSLTWDEVAWGYNAYTLGIDGRDEFGRFLPYDYLESFGDFKPPLYAYLSILPVKIWGLTEFATRFASAVFGVLTVLLTYFLTKEIFRKKSEYRISKSETNSNDKNKNVQNVSSLNHSNLDIVSNFGFRASSLAIIASAIMAISPWHIMLSRAAFEANVATFFLVLGVYLFLKAVHKNPWLLSLSAVSFVASMYTFNTARVVAPLLVIMLAIGFWKVLFKHKKQVIVAAIVGLAFLLPIVPFLLSDQAKLRFKEVNIFSDAKIVEIANQQIANDNNAWWSKILHNRRLAYGVEYVHHYFDNLSFEFLFIKGDGNPKFSTREVGQLYLWELPFFIAGILFLFRRREGRWWIIPLWLVLGIVPAATARETPHALRIEATLPTFQILVAYGLVEFLRVISNFKFQISNFKIKYIILILLLLLPIFSLAYFWENYTGHYAREYAREWQYGYKESIQYAKSVENEYDAIYVTKDLGRAYAYTLFYTQYPPELFRQQAVVERDPFGFVTVKQFDKYIFDKEIAERMSDQRILSIVTPGNVPEKAEVKKTFYLPNGEVALVAYTVE